MIQLFLFLLHTFLSVLPFFFTTFAHPPHFSLIFKEALQQWWKWQANSDSFHTRITNFKSHLTTQMPGLYREGLGHKLTTDHATTATTGSSIFSLVEKLNHFQCNKVNQKIPLLNGSFQRGQA